MRPLAREQDRRWSVAARVAAAGVVFCAGVACGQPVLSPYPAGAGDIVASAAAPMSGWYATGDSFNDRVEVRNQYGVLVRAITRSEIAALAPWMSLDGGPDGPSGLGFSASGRLLHILVHDDTVPADGLGSDALLRYDVSTDTLTLQARLDLYDRGDVWPHLGVAHHKSYVYVGTGANQIVVYLAGSSVAGSSPSGTWTLPGAGIVHGIAIDRDAGVLYAANDTGVYRATIPASPSSTPAFATLATVGNVRGLAWGDTYGGSGQRGLYILSAPSPTSSRIDFVSALVSGSFSNVTPIAYTSAAGAWHAVSPTADGRMLVASGDGARVVSDASDTRLSYDAWVRDELAQATVFGRGLISPDGEPDGWVIDGDVLPGQTRFHPATPDGAGWTVLLLLMNERVNGDANAPRDVRRILTRYAGLASDGVRPTRNADGIFKHWLDPLTGNTKAGWADEYATLSSMHIVFGAARAMDRYPDDPDIVRAASRIIFLTKNWDSYLQAGSDALAFKGLAAGGPDTGSWARPYHEGIVFAEQAGVYGGNSSAAIATQWFARPLWPTAAYLGARPITVAASSQFQPAFLSLYPALVSPRYRADTSPNGWRRQVDNLRWTSAAWTDDNGARYYTVFSAGTSPSGYNADTISNHPGNVATFTSLEALSALGDPAESVGAYAAYRKGARQAFKTGASILYRRPYDGGTFVPNSAGLPDVALGGLGLGELASPGAIDALLARAYPTVEMSPVDVTGDGAITIDDLYAQLQSPADLNGDGVVTQRDADGLEAWLRRREMGRMAAGQR